MIKALLMLVEAVGLLLAFLDFFNVSPKVQGFIDTRRYQLFLWLNRKGNEAVFQSKPYLLAIGVPSWILLVWAIYALATKSPESMHIFGWFMLFAIGPFLLLMVFLPLFYNALLTINQKGPGKTVGKVSFAMAIVSSVLQHTLPVSEKCRQFVAGLL